MSILNKFTDGILKNEFIDIIEWQDNTRDTLVWKFPRFQNEIKWGAKLTVRESQQAVFFNQGAMADVFQPGLYTLDTKNIPILRTILGLPYGFNSPFKADVYFVNTRQFIDQKWGTRNPITLHDERFGLVEIRAYGSFAFSIIDAGKFIKEVAGVNDVYKTDEIFNQLRSLILSKFSDAVGEGNFPIEKYAANMDELSKFVGDKMNEDFASFGLRISKFVVENVSLPEELKKEIFEYSRLGKVDLQKLAQMKAAKSIETLAEKPSNTVGGFGADLGMGLAYANMMNKMVNESFSNVNQTAAPTNTGHTPPPLLQLFVAANGQQTGPFTIDVVRQMIQERKITRESLVWKSGMANWAPAGTVTDLNELFSLVPPPPPAV